MIDSLQTRIQEHKEHFLKLKTAEYVAQDFIEALESINAIDDSSTLSTYEGSVYIYLYPKNIDDAELQLIPRISDLWGAHWDKTVKADQVEYRFHKHVDDTFLCITVQPKVEGTCQIIAKTTGKIKRVHKYVDVEEPEVEYLVDCGPDSDLEEVI